MDGEVDGEPGKHGRCVGGGFDGDGDVFVEGAVEIACEAVNRGVHVGVEGQLLVPTVAVGQFGRRVESLGVVEGEKGLGLVDESRVVKVDHVGSFEVRASGLGGVETPLRLVPQLARVHRSQVGRVATRDAHRVVLQESLGAVQTLWTQLVVAERA